MIKSLLRRSSSSLRRNRLGLEHSANMSSNAFLDVLAPRRKLGAPASTRTGAMSTDSIALRTSLRISSVGFAPALRLYAGA